MSSEHNPSQADGVQLSIQILPTSAAMLGACVTAISVVQLIEAHTSVVTMVDEIIAADSVLFLLAATISYLSIRSTPRRVRLETIADVMFVLALAVVAAASLMLAWELGYVER